MTQHHSASHEVGIIGAGPIGIELAVALKRLEMDYFHFDAHQIGHTISWWPKGTSTFSTTERIELAGIHTSVAHFQSIVFNWILQGT
jgi:thioredoxin reductase (NADPH)